MRNRTALISAFWSVTLFGVACAVQAAERIRYEVTPDAANRQFEISITVSGVNSPNLALQIPAWSPGAYFISNYSDAIADVSAGIPGDRALPVTHPDKLTWMVETQGAKSVRVTYRVKSSDIESADGTPKRAHISGPRTYLYVVNHKTDPALLLLHTPAEWKVATSLDPASAGGSSGSAYTAPNYDVLADAPVEMGDYAESNFTVKSVPHKVVLYGNTTGVDMEKLTGTCKRIAETETAFMGDIPFKRYVFMFRSMGTNGRGGGGLEHLGSTEISMRGAVDDRVRSVIAHEYFHLWNVKRIRPFVLGPFDYTGPVQTHNLWWSEGVTSYYGDLLSRRGGLNTEEEYLKHLGDTIGQLQNNPARLKVTADESSYKVWNGGGSQGYGQLSYYTKGELIGLCLDMKIRQLTDDRRSLDDVMRALYIQCGRGNKPGFGEDDIKQTVNQIASTDLSSFYDLLARSTDEMPFTECLAYAGLTLTKSETPTLTPNTGMFMQPDMSAGGLRLRAVTAGGAAETAGLKTDDLIVTVDGKPALDPENTLRRNPRTDTPYELVVERDGQKQTITYKVGTTRSFPYLIKPDAGATPKQIHLRESWLSSKPAHAA